jgi:hypothetical protein
MAGGKVDLEYRRVIPKDMATEMAEKNGFYAFVEPQLKRVRI